MKSQRRWDHGEPLPEPDLGEMLIDAVTIGTSDTAIFVVSLPVPGFFRWDGLLIALGSGTLTPTISFTGQTQRVGYMVRRDTATAQATSTHTSLGSTAASAWLTAWTYGLIQVTAPGDLTIAVRRSGGATSIIPGSSLEVYQIG